MEIVEAQEEKTLEQEPIRVQVKIPKQIQNGLKNGKQIQKQVNMKQILEELQ